MTNWFLDTEFDEDGKTIELISIGLVSDEKPERQYYAISSEFDPEHCNSWVKANVLPKLGDWPRTGRGLIAQNVRDMVLSSKKPIAFWGYFADYDWVVLCQLFGRMVDLPDGFPQYCNDIKQLMQMLRVLKSELPRQTKTSEHNALSDARWNKEAWLWCKKIADARVSARGLMLGD
jgi:hypothetical protein